MMPRLTSSRLPEIRIFVTFDLTTLSPQVTFQYTVIRPPYSGLGPFSPVINSLRNTQYKLDAKDHELLHFANCVTIIRLLLKITGSLHLPHVYIGDLPYALSLMGWRTIKVDLPRKGDLIFRGRNAGQISHVAIAISAYEVFHCTWGRNCVQESLRSFLREDKAAFYLYHPSNLLAIRDRRL